MLAPDSPGSVDDRVWTGYQTAADAIATQAMADPAVRASIVPCASTGGDDTACITQFVETFGRRAFRRPLIAEEIAGFVDLYTRRAEVTETGTFDEVVQVIVKAFMQSPSFVARTEISQTAEGSNYALNGYEVASRLSYMLWNSMPDEPLFTAAADGTLSTPAGILTQAQRMLGMDKARGMVALFHRAYAHMGPGTRWAEIQRDPSIYPGFNADVAAALSQETERFFEDAVFTKGSTFQSLITSNTAFVNAATAPLYGLSAAGYGTDLTEVTFDGSRPGVFTRAGFLTAYSLYNRPSAILRGAFIQKHVLCTEIGSPPPDAESTPLPNDPNLLTNRERTDAQTSGGECIGCHHALINPTGFTLENYDAIGAFQTNEKDTDALINTAANVQFGGTTQAVTNAADLMAKIAASPEAQRCYAKHWVEFAYERTMNPQDACVVDDMAGKLTSGGYTVINLIADLTQSESFRYRALETEAP
jgi:hypothetical protein